MKKKIAVRSLKRTCVKCNCSFKKGDVYYQCKETYSYDGHFDSYEYLKCPKCLYKENQRKKRFEKFKSTCKHLIIDTVWGYMAGECIQEPKYDQCLICGKILI